VFAKSLVLLGAQYSVDGRRATEPLPTTDQRRCHCGNATGQQASGAISGGIKAAATSDIEDRFNFESGSVRDIEEASP
jgi:hypothetical protein